MASQSMTSNNSIPSFMSLQSPDLKLMSENIELSITSLKDKYVSIIPFAFNDSECAELIDFSENIGYNDALVNLGFGHKETMNEFRNHKKLSIDNKIMSKYIFDRIKSLIPNEFNNRKLIDINERLRFLKYSTNEYFNAHYDGMYMRENGERSLITIMIYLNDNFNGGQFTFLHPTKQNIKHSIKPQKGMILLFEQNELFHQGDIVLNNNGGYKYCIRSDIMYSKDYINNNNNNNNNIIGQSYEVEKQTAYFQRKQKQKQQSIKSMKSQPRMNSKMKEDSLTIKVIHIWIIESCDNYYKSIKIFPKELYEQIARYCRIIGILDFICDENELIRLAKCAETAERYQEMTELMSELVKIKTHQFKCYCGHDNTNNNKCGDILSKEQRNLLSVAFKNVVGIQRSSWRTINSELSTLKDEESKKIKLYVCNEYIRVIERELIESCMKILNLLENYLIIKIEDCQKHNGEESLVFYIKMAGDYYRYLAEFADNPLYKEKANFYYTKAFKIAQKVLEPWHPTLLGLALNYAVYLYEIAKEPEKACVIAKDSFDSAIAQLDTLSDDVYKDSTLIMRLLRDNLTLWTSNDNGD